MVSRQFPGFGYRGTSHTRLTPDERPHVDDGLISTAWNAGTLHMQYVGLPTLAKSAVERVGKTMWEFVADCQRMVVLYAGVLDTRASIQAGLGGDIDREQPFAVTSNDGNGNVTGVWAWLPRGQVLDAFAVGGEFEQTFAKAFVVFAYQRWEEFARPNIAAALGTKHSDVKCDLMGEWRHLRNWIVHPDKKTEDAYFKSADLLARIPSCPQPQRPRITSGMLICMVGYLNTLHAVVNPEGLDPSMELTAVDAVLQEQLAQQAAPGYAVESLWKSFAPSRKAEPTGNKAD